MTRPAVTLAELNALPDPAARELLRPAVDSEAWLSAMIGTRPYGAVDALLDRSDAAVAALDGPELAAALRAHPRIGERTRGGSREATWSREEQAGAALMTDDVELALHQGNLEYERRFGQVFLICATGRGSTEILADLNERLDNDPDAEQQVVRRELAGIARLRLQRIVS